MSGLLRVIANKKAETAGGGGNFNFFDAKDSHEMCTSVMTTAARRILATTLQAFTKALGELKAAQPKDVWQGWPWFLLLLGRGSFLSFLLSHIHG